MKLSNAIATGRVLLRAHAGIFVEGGYGCALGMAYKASGLVAESKILGYTMNECFKAWPWTMQLPKTPLCDCYVGDCNLGQMITHLFDTHVMQAADCKVEAWTLDQLIDWVRSVEPAEDVPSSDGALAATEARAEVGEK